MKKIVLAFCAVAMLFCGSLRAQDIAGDWQGTVKVGKGQRTILKISHDENGSLTAIFYSIDQGLDGLPVSSITFDKSILKYSIGSIHGAYQGKLSANANHYVFNSNEAEVLREMNAFLEALP
jgi:hypothetical protein